jgi:hypothetical protein
VSLNLVNDWQIIDDPQTVTYYVKTGEGTYASGVSISGCQRSHKNPSGEELALEVEQNGKGEMQVMRSAWYLWTTKLGSIVPAIGDYLTDTASTKWIVKKSVPMDWDGGGVFERYKCVCIRGV